MKKKDNRLWFVPNLDKLPTKYKKVLRWVVVLLLCMAVYFAIHIE